jgi:hypothetical protein
MSVRNGARRSVAGVMAGSCARRWRARFARCTVGVVTWWEVVDVSEWPELQGEPRGLRAKQWVTDPSGQPWLRKGIRGWDKVAGGSRPTECAIEAFTLELARRCGFDVAHGRAATWKSAAGEVRGFVSRKFHDESEEQRTGAELVDSGAREDTAARVAASLPIVRSALVQQQDTYERRWGESIDLVTPFLKMLAFDAWIGNGDRHLGNWALLVSRHTCRLAPMFDTAGCLGAELLANHACLAATATEATLATYAHGCKSGFGDGSTRPGIFQDEVLSAVRAWPEWGSAYREVVPRCKAALSNDAPALLASVPDAWWPQQRRWFAHRMLVLRVKLLEGAHP